MCQMCEEYEAELRRMGLVVEADKVRMERHGTTPTRTTRTEPAKTDGRDGSVDARA